MSESPPERQGSSRRVRGGALMVLGIAGIGLAVFGVGSVWVYGGRIASFGDEAIDKGDVRLMGLAEVAGDARTGIALTRGVATKIELELRGRVQESIEVKTRPALLELDRKLRKGLDRIQVWLGKASQGLEIFEAGLFMLSEGGLLDDADPEKIDQIFESLRQANAGFESLERDVVMLEDMLFAVSQGKRPVREERELRLLSDRIDRSLVDLSAHAERFEEGSTQLVEGLRGSQSRLQKRVLQIQLVLSVLLVWQAGAQWCLFRAGRRICYT